MSLTEKINKEIAVWIQKIEKEQDRIDRMKKEIKNLRKLLGLAEGLEQ